MTAILEIVKTRFTKYSSRHVGLNWAEVEGRVNANGAYLSALQQMENTGGEPDVIGYDEKTNKYIIMDCSKESPAGRRSLCYDEAARKSRQKFPPSDSAENMADKMGIELLTEEDYRLLQTLGEFDTKTSSWLKTPNSIRSLGGSIFGDRRYNNVFVYHNGADSYYAARGFRGKLLI